MAIPLIIIQSMKTIEEYLVGINNYLLNKKIINIWPPSSFRNFIMK